MELRAAIETIVPRILDLLARATPAFKVLWHKEESGYQVFCKEFVDTKFSNAKEQENFFTKQFKTLDNYLRCSLTKDSTINNSLAIALDGLGLVHEKEEIRAVNVVDLTLPAETPRAKVAWTFDSKDLDVAIERSRRLSVTEHSLIECTLDSHKVYIDFTGPQFDCFETDFKLSRPGLLRKASDIPYLKKIEDFGFASPVGEQTKRNILSLPPLLQALVNEGLDKIKTV